MFTAVALASPSSVDSGSFTSTFSSTATVSTAAAFSVSTGADFRYCPKSNFSSTTVPHATKVFSFFKASSNCPLSSNCSVTNVLKFSNVISSASTPNDLFTISSIVCSTSFATIASSAPFTSPSNTAMYALTTQIHMITSSALHILPTLLKSNALNKDAFRSSADPVARSATLHNISKALRVFSAPAKNSNTFFTKASSVKSVIACFSLNPNGRSSSLYFCKRSSTALRSHSVNGAKCADFEIPLPICLSSCWLFFVVAFIFCSTVLQ